MSVTLFVTYPGSSSDRFDRDYWVDQHFSLVREVWRPHGLESLGAFFPEGEDGDVVAICPVTFRNEAAMREALAAPETKRVMDDIRNFTDLQSHQSIARPVQG